MRRGRITALLGVLITVISVGFALTAGVASAASPRDICTDLQDGVLNGSYTPADLTAYQDALRNDPTIAGYCTAIPVTLVTVTPTPVCVEVTSTTPGAVLAPNGKYYNTATNASGESCGPAAPAATAVCTEVTSTTPGAVLAPNGKYYNTATNAGGESCGPATTHAAAVIPAQAHVAAATKTKTNNKPAGVSPAQHTAAAPLATTKTSGTLPFTGAELSIFAIVGLALLGAGVLLRLTTRDKRTSA